MRNKIQQACKEYDSCIATYGIIGVHNMLNLLFHLLQFTTSQVVVAASASVQLASVPDNIDIFNTTTHFSSWARLMTMPVDPPVPGEERLITPCCTIDAQLLHNNAGLTGSLSQASWQVLAHDAESLSNDGLDCQLIDGNGNAWFDNYQEEDVDKTSPQLANVLTLDRNSNSLANMLLDI